jgi:DNA-binding MarR family transcriptional regulator
MTANSESEQLALRAWFLVHRTRDVLRTCEDQIFGEYGLTAEQYAVLSIMKLLKAPIRVTDVADVSMIVDRMVKAGLITRRRDKGDRRTVILNITTKGENALKPATLAGWNFIREILSPLSNEDKRAFVNVHEMVKYRALQYLNPGLDIEEMRRNEITNRPDLMKRLAQYISASVPQAESHSGRKRKTIRRA